MLDTKQLKMAPFNDKIHRDLNLIDDFETLAQEIWNYVIFKR